MYGLVYKGPSALARSVNHLTNILQIKEKERTDERTRTSDLISLRVIGQGLQGFAQTCKSAISKGVSVLYLAARCTVLHLRCYQSGIRSLQITRRQFLCTRCACNEW